MTPEEQKHKRLTDKHVSDWTAQKHRPDFDTVRTLMGYLAKAELLAKEEGRDTQTGFIGGPGLKDWNLDLLYEAARRAHPKTWRKAFAEHQKGGGKPESARGSIQRAMGKPVDEKPQSESVRDSIRRAMNPGGSK
jgi:hypothetical protein